MKKTVVLCHGVFDLLNTGHVEHLRGARKFGDTLVVSVVSDRFISKFKRPVIYDENERMSLISALKCVDRVILCDAIGPELIIEQLRPDVYVRGYDYRDKRMPESNLLEKLGIPVRFTDNNLPHSTEIINKIFSLCRNHPEFQYIQ